MLLTWYVVPVICTRLPGARVMLVLCDASTWLHRQEKKARWVNAECCSIHSIWCINIYMYIDRKYWHIISSNKCGWGIMIMMMMVNHDGVLTLVHFTDVLPVYGHKTGCKKMHLDGRNKQVVVRYNSVLGSIMPARKGDGTNELRHTMIPYHLLPNRHQEHIHSIVCRLGKKEKERIKEKRQE